MFFLRPELMSVRRHLKIGEGAAGAGKNPSEKEKAEGLNERGLVISDLRFEGE